MLENNHEKKPKKYAGILAHPTSFPSPYGIGDLGKGAYRFIDFLANSGLNLWQVLPLGHTGFCDSPYQPFSAFAGQPLIIDLDALKEYKLLSEDDFTDMPEWDPVHIDYGTLITFKTKLLKLAYERFTDPDYEDGLSTDEEQMAAFASFKKDSSWLADYSLFMAGKDFHEGMPWYMWEDSLKAPTKRQRTTWEKKLANEIGYYDFIQFLFHTQWMAIKEYANEKNISIVGDAPIFLAWDSADVWSHQELFMLDSKGYPTEVAGVPPDYFSETGQLWGNPLYDWKYHKKTGYEWWMQRIAYCYQLYDVLRIDHFRGFDEYWFVPYGDPTAQNGHWEKGPGYELFAVMKKKLGKKKVIAEDLGFLTPSVIRLVKKTGYPGMKILQFAFDAGNDSEYLPHNYDKNCVVYTGTHDNDTTVGFIQNMPEKDKKFAKKYLGHKNDKKLCFEIVRAALSSCADTAVIPMQDYLELDSSARINIPSTLGCNWKWRMDKEALDPKLAKKIYKMAKLYGRL